jgi:signal transduction histidine kinase
MATPNATAPVLETLVLERRLDGSFVLCDEPPRWLRRLGGGEPRRDQPLAIDRLLPFVEAFLPEAERAWAGEGAARVDCGLWTETTAEGEEVHLEAMAIRVGARALLMIARNDQLLFERRRVLQRARELRLAHDALSREIERKDVLIHCIIHDLAGPLNSILGALSLLGEQPLHDPSAALIQVALKAAMRQRELIREILDTFASERSALDSGDDFTVAPDLGAAVAQVIEALLPLASSRGVRLLGPPPAGAGPPCKVIGEERRLARVLFNLVQNAIRFSPQGAAVRVSLRDEPDAVRVAVEDEGPGVAPDVAPHLFQKFARGRDPGAGTGLGLYFCRITVENWGGTIGYEALPGAGARFWFRLRRADGPADPGQAEARIGGTAHGEAAAGGR